jgi:hypothetical protein
MDTSNMTPEQKIEQGLRQGSSAGGAAAGFGNLTPEQAKGILANGVSDGAWFQEVMRIKAGGTAAGAIDLTPEQAKKALEDAGATSEQKIEFGLKMQNTPGKMLNAAEALAQVLSTPQLNTLGKALGPAQAAAPAFSPIDRRF